MPKTYYKKRKSELKKLKTKVNKIIKLDLPPFRLYQVNTIAEAFTTMASFSAPGTRLLQNYFYGTTYYDNGVLGNKIQPHSLTVKGLVYADLNSTISVGCRIIIVMDMQNSNATKISTYGTDILYQNVLLNGSYTGTTAYTTPYFLGDFSLQKPRRFRVLYDKTFVLPGKAGGGTTGANVNGGNTGDVKLINIKIKLDKYKMSFYDNSLQLNDAFDKEPYMFLLCSGTTTVPTMDYVTSFHYTSS